MKANTVFSDWLFITISHSLSESAPDWIRTSDRPLRRRVLYPTELQALRGCLITRARGEVKIRVVFFSGLSARGVGFWGR
jgi:hypothetical protein